MREDVETLIIGNGKMGAEYARVFRDGFRRPFSIAGRASERVRASAAAEGARGVYAFSELDDAALRAFRTVIVATSEENLESVTRRLLAAGVRRILLEKPGALSARGSAELASAAEMGGAYVRIACNRRYYPSVRKLREILRNEPPTTATFEFTEITGQLGGLAKPASVMARWGLINPIHVLDTLTFVLGEITELAADQAGKDAIAWHPTGAIFRGTARAGRTPVAYLTNWLSPGRWDLQVMTSAGRYKLSPMEKLVVMRHDSRFQWLDVELPPGPGDAFKPGLYEMISSFERETGCELPDLRESTRTLEHLTKIFGYPS